jgi:class 3 adenylate cyclase
MLFYALEERMDRSLIENWTVKVSELYSSQMLPSGTLTFLFTDIEGSTHMWEQYPDEMRIALERHDALIESAVVEQAGMVVRPRGEGVVLLFFLAPQTLFVLLSLSNISCLLNIGPSLRYKCALPLILGRRTCATVIIMEVQ